MRRNDVLLIVSGSRDWVDEIPVRELLSKFDPAWTIVIHGKCRGLDMMVDRVAKSMGFVVAAFPADWNRHGNGAGPIRNKDMFNIGTLNQKWGVAVHAGIFPLPQSRGTKNMYTLCQYGGFDIHVPDACKNYL
jgi:hypothetical protein